MQIHRSSNTESVDEENPNVYLKDVNNNISSACEAKSGLIISNDELARANISPTDANVLEAER